MIDTYKIKAIKKGSEFGYVITIQAEKKDEAITMAKRRMVKMIEGIDTTEYLFSVQSKKPVIVKINPLQVISKT